MFKWFELILAFIISAIAPLVLLVIINKSESSTVIESDGSVSMTAQWVSFTFTSYLFTVLYIFVLYLLLSATIKWLRRKIFK
ncbi:hypothetical protein MU1_36850 [Paenibacillus glycanilyticus]|uniref:Uncharacterized protein n=1 Tax=Paenibacillus glycanilyticus TaxID=126569 RepID=A0ABQ6GGX5_9BACL|nr:hypothetical protein MU1_36850 [Paenibacillus glycanilyticus]